MAKWIQKASRMPGRRISERTAGSTPEEPGLTTGRTSVMISAPVSVGTGAGVVRISRPRPVMRSAMVAAPGPSRRNSTTSTRTTAPRAASPAKPANQPKAPTARARGATASSCPTCPASPVIWLTTGICRGVNHSATRRTTEVKMQASPAPSRMRASTAVGTASAAASSSWAADITSIPVATTQETPKRSRHTPTGIWHTA